MCPVKVSFSESLKSIQQSCVEHLLRAMAHVRATGDSEVNNLCFHGKWPESQVGNTDIKYVTTCKVSVVTKR